MSSSDSENSSDIDSSSESSRSRSRSPINVRRDDGRRGRGRPRRGWHGRGGAQPGSGAPRKEFDQLCTSSQYRREAEEVARMQERWEANKNKFLKLVNKQVGPNAKAMVERALWSEAQAEYDMQTLAIGRPQAVSVLEALTILLHLCLSKFAYKNIAKMVRTATNFSTFPCYDYVAAKKVTCRPPPNTIDIKEEKAKVKIKALLKHTIDRIVQFGNEIDEKLEAMGRNVSCTFNVSWGMDSCTSNRPYQMPWRNPRNRNRSDESVFAVTMNPINFRTDNGLELWVNERVASRLFVRPIMIAFEKEKKEYVRRYDLNL